MKNKTAIKIIGKRIKERRVALCYTEESFAHMVGLGDVYYAGIEKGMVNPSELCLKRIAYALGTSVPELREGL